MEETKTIGNKTYTHSQFRNEAFARNIGLFTKKELDSIQNYTIAIPGMGAVGGEHLLSATRQGFEKFKIADFDEYDIVNFNRQCGATTETIGAKKIEVMEKEVLKINPYCKIKSYPEGINNKNLESFLSGTDIVIDGLDFFEQDMRRKLFNTALENNIPVITAGPVGFGYSGITFLPGGPNFDEYFQIKDDMPDFMKTMHFAIGITGLLFPPYIKGTDVRTKKTTSSIIGVNAASAYAITEAIKITTGKGKIKAAPYLHRHDLYLQKHKITKMSPLLFKSLKTVARFLKKL